MANKFRESDRPIVISDRSSNILYDGQPSNFSLVFLCFRELSVKLKRPLQLYFWQPSRLRGSDIEIPYANPSALLMIASQNA